MENLIKKINIYPSTDFENHVFIKDKKSIFNIIKYVNDKNKFQKNQSPL